MQGDRPTRMALAVAVVCFATSLHSVPAFPLPFYLSRWNQLSEKEASLPVDPAGRPSPSSGGLQMAFLQEAALAPQQPPFLDALGEAPLSPEKHELLTRQLDKVRSLQSALASKRVELQSALDEEHVRPPASQPMANGLRAAPQDLQALKVVPVSPLQHWQEVQSQFNVVPESQDLKTSRQHVGQLGDYVRLEQILQERLKAQAAERLSRLEIEKQMQSERALETANATIEMLLEAKVAQKEHFLAEESKENIALAQAEKKLALAQEASDQKLAEVQIREREVEEEAVRAVRVARSRIEQANSEIHELQAELREATSQALQARAATGEERYSLAAY